MNLISNLNFRADVGKWIPVLPILQTNMAIKVALGVIGFLGYFLFCALRSEKNFQNLQKIPLETLSNNLCWPNEVKVDFWGNRSVKILDRKFYLEELARLLKEKLKSSDLTKTDCKLGQTVGRQIWSYHCAAKEKWKKDCENKPYWALFIIKLRKYFQRDKTDFYMNFDFSEKQCNLPVPGLEEIQSIQISKLENISTWFGGYNFCDVEVTTISGQKEKENNFYIENCALLLRGLRQKAPNVQIIGVSSERLTDFLTLADRIEKRSREENHRVPSPEYILKQIFAKLTYEEESNLYVSNDTCRQPRINQEAN
jgi:hypothetical protein